MRLRSGLRSTSIRARGLRLLAAAACVATLVHAPAGRPLADGGDTEERQAVAQLARQVDLLEKRVDLASGEEFYLLIDPAGGTLKLMLHGAVLRDYQILGLDVGTPRIAFRERGLGSGWAGRVWAAGALVPPRERERVEIVPPDSSAADSSLAPVMPPTPEEAYPVPSRYHVRYEGGLSLEVRPSELDTSVATWKRATAKVQVWARDLHAALQRHPEDVVRLRLVLRPEDAASLYRALPPDTRLLVLPASS